MLVVLFEALHVLRWLWDLLKFPVHILPDLQEGQIPSEKEYQLVEPRRIVFSTRVSILWNVIPPVIGLTKGLPSGLENLKMAPLGMKIEVYPYGCSIF